MDEENLPDNEEMEPLNEGKTSDNKSKSLIERPDGYNKCYLFWLLITVSFGTIQFGYMIGSWNSASAAYGKKDGWDDDEMTTKVMIVQALTTAGAAVGALFSGNIAFLGRWNCIIIANLILTVGVCLTLID